MKEKQIDLTARIEREYYDPKGNMNLDSAYQLTVAELGLQQTKRDQIIAFYLAVLGLVSPSLIGLDVHNAIKGSIFLMLYFIGVMFSHVILRYRIYKEVYWIACRVISQLNNIKPENRYKSVIYRIFYEELKENEDTIVRKNKKDKVSLIRSFKRQINSAETLLFETMVVFSTGVGAMAVGFFWSVSMWAAIALIAFLVIEIIRLNYKYCSRLVKLYRCIETEDSGEKVKELESTFKKAWMLRSFLDDVLEDGPEGK